MISLAILPDGRIVSGSDDKSIKIWNSVTGICDKTLVGHTSVSDDDDDFILSFYITANCYYYCCDYYNV